jgi:hypothetical protein
MLAQERGILVRHATPVWRAKMRDPEPGPPGSRQQALAEARKLVRTLASAPDPKRRAQAVLSELRHSGGWSPEARSAIEAADAWLRERPAVEAIGPRLRALLARLA